MVLYVPYIALFLSVCCLWIPLRITKAWWKFFLFLGVVLSLLLHQTTLWGGAFLLLFYFLIKKYQHALSPQKERLWGAALFLGLMILTGLLPVACFYELPVLSNVHFTPDAVPFNLAFHFGGVAVGVIVIGLTLERATALQAWKELVCPTLWCWFWAVVALLLSALVLGFVKWEPKIPAHLFLWMFSNLFFTCIAEEGFFRGFFQKFLTQRYASHSFLGILISSLAFGGAHYRGGPAYMLLATIAGIFYGWVYHRTKRIEASMLTHFLLNLTHLIFFTYPALRG